MANFYMGEDVEYMGGRRKPRTRLGKRIKARKDKMLAKIPPENRKKAIAIMAMPIPPLTKRLMLAKLLKGGVSRKARRAAGKAGLTAASIATGGAAGLFAAIGKRIKKRRAARRAAAQQAAEQEQAPAPSEIMEEQTKNYSVAPAPLRTKVNGKRVRSVQRDDQDDQDDQEQAAPAPESVQVAPAAPVQAGMNKMILPLAIGGAALYFLSQKKN